MIKVSALLLVLIPAFAQANLCRTLTEDPTLMREKLSQELTPSEDLATNEPWTVMLETRAKAYKLYDRVLRQARSEEPVLPQWETLSLLANAEMAYYHQHLGDVLEMALANKSAKSMNEKILISLRKNLRNVVPKDTIEKRIEKLVNKEPGSILQALGQMDLSEVQRLVYGTNPLRPSEDSLLGQYINATGATTVVRTFPKGPRRMDGPKRLVVSLSRSSFKRYNKLFGFLNFLIHVHTPNQETLSLSHEGLFGSYGRNKSDFRAPRLGTLLPHILLSTSEGQRARIFFDLALSAGMAREPWRLENYCARSGYSSCTHWFGNIPVGDKRVDKYTFPGRVDEHADASVGKGPQTRKLKPFKNPNPLTSLVWKVPGHEQLADVLGLQKSNIEGEFANPGWVAYTLLGAAGVDRVPFVFYSTRDHRQPIPRNFDLQISAY
jgi:hypothetical protein